ncbi:MAG: response regulator [Pseudomonadota bacterium]|nr:response regulator [Pseudomonadota bacterium]
MVPVRLCPLVLVADDNADLADSLGWCLEAVGYRTAVAYDGRQAIESACALRPSIVILDLAMPRVDGYAAAREIRAVLGEDVLMIAHTAWGHEGARQRTMEAGFNHHVVKTTELTVLLRLLTGYEKQLVTTAAMVPARRIEAALPTSEPGRRYLADATPTAPLCRPLLVEIASA